MNNYTINLRSGKTVNKVGAGHKKITKNGQEWLQILNGGDVVAEYSMDTVAHWDSEKVED